MAFSAEREDMEETALIDTVLPPESSKLLQGAAFPFCMMVLPFSSVALDTGKRIKGADAGFRRMGPGGSIAERQEKAEARV